MQVYCNHTGYVQGRPIQILVQGTAPENVILKDHLGQELAVLPVKLEESPADWQLGECFSVAVTQDLVLGTYRLEWPGHSTSFEVHGEEWYAELISDLLFYFKGQRSSGEFDRADRKAPFVGGLRRERQDLRGGWYDASGDMSKYLTHLSYALGKNPQQTPMVVWALLEAEEAMAKLEGPRWERLRKRALEEALHGADFLVRMQDPKGYFYQTLFDQWSKDPEKREICAYATQAGIKSERWEASFRAGGGLAIAALARAARRGERGDFAPEIYGEKAVVGYEHLRTYNKDYVFDGIENLQDDYCALLAAVELAHATQDPHYAKDASIWAHSLMSKQAMSGDWPGALFVDEEMQIPFYHASDAGLPWVALNAYLEVETDPVVRAKVESTLVLGLSFELGITGEVPNPFGYPRQYVRPVDGNLETRFFMPHHNESGYWWQGENARLGSLSSAAMAVAQKPIFADLSKDLVDYAWNQVDWILGRNPADACMMHRRGRNNPLYEIHFPNAPGGICNGITSRFADDLGWQLGPQCEESDQPHQRWRWGEQWIPHGAWALLALARCAARKV